jgi:heme/copper-type cytochrome/quinol oxidase subunit 1
MTVTLSTQLMAASLAVIAIEGAVYTFVNDKRIPSGWFTVFVILVFLFFLMSIYVGGKGVNKVRKAVFDGNWTINLVRDEFAWQALLGVLGIICLFVSLVTAGKTKEETMQQDLSNLRYTVEKQQQYLGGVEKQLEELKQQDLSNLTQTIEKQQQLLNGFQKQLENSRGKP